MNSYLQLLQWMMGSPQAQAAMPMTAQPMTPPRPGAQAPTLAQAGGPTMPLMTPATAPTLTPPPSPAAPMAGRMPPLPMAATPMPGNVRGQGRRRGRGKPAAYRNPNMRQDEEQPTSGLLSGLLTASMPAYMGGNPYWMPGDRR